MGLIGLIRKTRRSKGETCVEGSRSSILDVIPLAQSPITSHTSKPTYKWMVVTVPDDVERNALSPCCMREVETRAAGILENPM